MKYISILLFCLIFFKSNAQEIVSAGGDTYTNSNISVSWTIGEPVTETISNTSNILTQGFHQTKLSVIGIYDISSKDMLISLYPNPTQDFVNLKTVDYENLSFQLFSFNGKLIKTNKLFSKNTEVKLNNLSAASYFIKILEWDKIIKTYKIIKK